MNILGLCAYHALLRFMVSGSYGSSACMYQENADHLITVLDIYIKKKLILPLMISRLHFLSVN